MGETVYGLIFKFINIFRNNGFKYNISPMNEHPHKLDEVMNINRKLDLFSGKCNVGPHKSDIVGYSIDKNVNISGGPVRRGDGDSVYFQDPDGNHLEIHCDDK